MNTRAGEALDRGPAAELAVELGRHARLLHALKAHLAAYLPEGLDVAAFPLLFTLVREGPRRQGELAELTFLDPSTVSRHIGQLVRSGFVERRPDPQDGRAVHLAVTDEGERVAHEIWERRREVIAEALHAWAPDDLRTLVHLLSRLNDDLEAHRPRFGRASDGAPARAGERTPDQETP